MDPIAKEVWCEALRSGEFEQGGGALKERGKFCCLGVAREIFPALGRCRDREFLNSPACQLLGISDAQCRELADMNDGGYSFKTIADYIERNL